MANVTKLSDFYIKVTPRSMDSTNEHSRKDDLSGLHGHFGSETSSTTSSASEVASTDVPTISSQTSQSTRRPRQYVITASKHAPAAPEHTKGPTPTKPIHRIGTAVIYPRHTSVTLSKSPAPRKNDNFGFCQSQMDAAEPSIPSEAWWNQQTQIDEPMSALTVESHQSFDTGSSSRNPSSKIPRRKRDYPPTCYLDPFAQNGADDMCDPPRLPASWKPPGYCPAPVPVGSPAKPAKNLRSRRLSGPASTKQPRSSASPSPNSPISVNHNRVAATIDIESVPQPSLEATVSVAAQPRSRSTSHTSTFSHRRRNSEGTQLPPPEEVYTQIIYFTDCPHTSPPATRPINAQPMLQTLSQELTQLPSQTIKAQVALAARITRQKQIYTIFGLCANCDWKMRRDMESDVLRHFSHKRYQLEKRLGHLEMQEGEEKPASPLTSEAPTWEIDEHQVDLKLSILMLESEIEQLEADQDQEVEKVWQGYARRWGPGAIGIQRRLKDEGSDERSRAEASATDGTAQSLGWVDNVRAEGRMKLDWIRPDIKKK